MSDEMRALVFASSEHVAAPICEVLAQDGIDCAYRSADELRAGLAYGAGVVLLSEEVLSTATLGELTAFLSEQPAWSDLSVLLLISQSEAGERFLDTSRSLRERWNVTVLERAVRSATLVTVVRSALRSRRRQYELRDLLAWLGDRVEARASELATARVQLRRETAGREAAEAQHQGSEDRFAKVFDASPLPITITTLDEGRYVDINSSALEHLGFHRDEIIGRTTDELGQWRRDDGGPRRELIRRLEEGGSLRDVELRFRTKGGDTRHSLAAFESIELDGERCLLMMFVDITQRKRTESQLKEAVEKTMQNATWFSHQVMTELAQLRSGDLAEHSEAELTNREKQVLERIAAGKTNAEIGEALDLAERTVRNYITNIYSKLGVHSRAEAVVWARERGL